MVLTPTGNGAPPALAGELHDAIEQALGVSCHVVVLTADEWRTVVAENPYPDQAASDPTSVHAVVQQDDLAPEEEQTLTRLLAEARAGGSPDHLTVVGRTTYLCTPGGMGRSTLAERLARARKPGQDRATARNWRTVEALAHLLDG